MSDDKMPLILHVGDIVTDGVGDRGKVRKLGQRKVKSVHNMALANPDEGGPIFEAHPDTVMVVWETIDGKPAFMQASWEDVADLTLIEAAQPVAPPAGE